MKPIMHRFMMAWPMDAMSVALSRDKSTKLRSIRMSVSRMTPLFLGRRFNFFWWRLCCFLVDCLSWSSSSAMESLRRASTDSDAFNVLEKSVDSDVMELRGEAIIFSCSASSNAAAAAAASASAIAVISAQASCSFLTRISDCSRNFADRKSMVIVSKKKSDGFVLGAHGSPQSSKCFRAPA